MTGPEHYRKAEELLAGRHLPAAEDGTRTFWVPASADDIALAQVHATLALAAATAATALNDGEDGTPGPVYRTWLAVASAETA